MYDYGWRHYMADLGRWNGIDQLAEMYVSTSTYAYVANNPVMRFDVDGRWFNDDGTIDTSGRTLGLTSGKQYLHRFLGSNKNDGGGGSLTVGNLMSALSPTFQFDKGAEKFYKENYPEFYDFVMNVLPNIIEDANFMSVLSDTSGFSMEELTKMFKSDTNYALMGYNKIGASVADYPFGENPESYPINLVRVNIDTLNWFKSANRDTKTLEGITNVVQMIGFVSHEINHWGVSAGTNSSFRAKNLGGDPGDYFERKLINSM